MTMPNDLFNDQTDIDPNKNYLEELVGEGKKFTTPEELARGKAQSDLFISQIERENAELRKELDTRLKYEDLLTQIKQTPPQQPPVPGEPDGKPAMTPADVERLLEQREQRNRATQNANIVKDKLQQVLGPNYVQQLRQKTAELNMTEEQMYNLSQVNPKAAIKLLGLDEAPRNELFSAPPRSQLSASPQGNNKRGFSYYENIRKQDIRGYFDPKVQNQMFSDIQAMGEENFYNS